MSRIVGLLVLSSIASADEPLRMGAEWFSHLQDPQTRIAALYEREKKVTEAKYLEAPEKFAADNHQTFVFPCPQPGKPETQAVVTLLDWEGSRDISCGPEPSAYPPHPLELQRRREWDAEFTAKKQLWKPGQPWLGGVSGFLVDPSGTQVGEPFFASPAIIADFDGDGMLDLAGVSRYHLERKVGKERVADCFQLSSLVGGPAPKARFCCNVRDDMRLQRTWRFTVRPAGSGTLDIVLVPTSKKAAEVVFHVTADGLKEATSPLPEGILIDRELLSDDWDGPKKFLAKHGLKFSGTGSDNAREVDASLPPLASLSPLEMANGNGYNWALPDIAGLAPREAALAIARHHFHPLTLSHYDLETTGDPVPPAKSGWLEKWFDGAGWGSEQVTVWWLRDDKAERWTEKYDTTFLVEKDDPQETGRRIAIAHELDRIRLVPKSPLIPYDKGDHMGGADIPIYRIRAFSDAPQPMATTFGKCTPSLWRTVGYRYDRDLSSVLAYTLTEPSPETGDPRPIKELAPVWLSPAEINHTPPALCRAAIRAIGKNRWKDLEPLLLSLRGSFGPPSQEEKQLADLERRREELYTKRWNSGILDDKTEIAIERETRKVERDRIELTSRLAGQPAFELRTSVEKALEDLKKPPGKK